MKHTITDKSPTSKLITITLDKEDLAKIRKETSTHLGKDLKIEGFRKGKAPTNLVEKQLDPMKLETEVVNDAVNFYFNKVSITEKLDVINQPKIEIIKAVPKEELEFTAKVEVSPEIQLKSLDNLKTEQQAVEVSAEEIDQVLENIRNDMASKVSVAKSAEDGDEVWIDFVGTKPDGTTIEGASGEQYPLLLGSNTFIDGFEENLVGKKKGDQFEFDITFPDDYRAEKLAGEDAKFKINVTDVKEIKKPNLDDELAQTAARLDTLQQLKDDIKENLALQKQSKSDVEYRHNLLDELIELNVDNLPVPAVMLDRQIEQLRGDFARNLATRGLTLDQFIEQSEHSSNEDFENNEMKPAAEKQVRRGLVLAHIVRSNDIEVSDDQLNGQIDRIKTQQANAQQLHDHLETNEGRADVKNQMLSDMALAHLAKLNQGE